MVHDSEPRSIHEELRNAARDREEQRLRNRAERLAELERTKTQFLNLASHELRGPLTVLRGYISMLEEGSIPVEQIPAIARLLETKLAQIDLLAEQMLETARLDQDVTAQREDMIDVGEVVHEQVEIFRPLSGRHRVVVKQDAAPLVVKGDRSRISTIVANLLDNALKYSPEGGDIGLSSGRLDRDVYVAVRDEGLGIRAEDIPKLFTRFGRLAIEDNITIPGTGLGLFLCREIAHRHGGDISVRSEPGVGSEFTLTLPSIA